MNIGLTYDLKTDPVDERQAELDSWTTIEALEGALRTLGHQVTQLGNAQQLLSDPARLRAVDLVFNIAEGCHGRCREAWVPTLLEHWGVPFVGSGSRTQALGLDKVMSKRLVQASGGRTPDGVTMREKRDLQRACSLRFPLIVKPRAEGSGMGIDAGAVVHHVTALEDRVAWLLERLQGPVLVEEFIPCGELTVFLMGNNPPAAFPAIQRLLDPQTRLSCHVVAATQATQWLAPLELTPGLDANARALAVLAFNALQCHDVARVDLRVDGCGQVYFLEINPLPSFDPEGTLGLLAEYLHTTYVALIGRILDAALRRYMSPEPVMAHGDVDR